MKSWRKTLPVLALSGLLVLLGHDVLMAADPHGNPGAYAVVTGSHSSADTSDCGMNEGLQLTGLNVLDPEMANTQKFVTPVDIRAPEVGCISWMRAPGQPPDVRRAWLQVFLN